MAKMEVMDVYNLAYKWADAYGTPLGLNPDLIAKYMTGIAWKESNFNPDAKNKASSARGLYQMLINTQREVESKRAKVPFATASLKSSAYPKAPVSKVLPDKIYNPDYATQLAVLEFLYQLKRYNYDYTKALHAYNQGSYPGGNKSDGANYANSVEQNVKKLPTDLALNKNYQKIDTEQASYIYPFS